jgi:D-aminoacyl-tRNA deacylase
MKAVIQRVQRASVTVDKKLISSIEKGYCVLIGIETNDTQSDIEQIAKKILSVRLFPSADTEREWNQSIVDIQGEILSISQFTLHAITKKGTKPDFHKGNFM